jgi:hypothetical protein
MPQVHRGLQFQNPRIVSKYNGSQKEQLAHHTIPESIDALMAVPIFSWTKKHTAAASNNIDSTLGDSQEISERKRNKRKSRILDWSTELSHAGNIVSYWELRLAKLKGRRTSSKTRALRRRDTGIPIHTPLNDDEVRNEISSSRKFLRDVRSNHEELRTTCLKHQAREIDAAADRDPTT